MPPSLKIALAPSASAPQWCEPILRSVPEWFGIESATRQYIADTARLPTLVARSGDECVGFVTLAQFFPGSVEVHCIAVRKDWHGRGVGTALVDGAAAHARSVGARMLFVKTQGPSKPNAGYARTLHFYESRGFTALEELQGVWPGLPCLILAMPLAEKSRTT